MSATADMEVVHRVLEETGVDQTVSAPSLSDYVQGVTERLADWLQHRTPALGGFFSWVGRLAPWLAAVAGGLVVTILIVIVVKALLARHRRPASLAVAGITPGPALVVSERDRAAWRTEFERRLGARDLAGALEALWWWFACSIATTHVEASWTSIELLARCRRSDLAPQARALDRLLYGGTRPALDDLRRFVNHADSALR